MTLDDLIALNDEIAALVRSGVPLESGLRELSVDLPGRLGHSTAILAERTARGETLAEAIATDRSNWPPVYRAVVEAGIRAGRLPAALEAMTAAARQLSQTQRAITIGAIYPLLVLLAAWAGAIVFCCLVAPSLATGFAALGTPGHSLFASLARAGERAWYWGPILPALLIVLSALWWHTSRRGAVVSFGPAARLMARIPRIGQFLQLARTATFLELLALLLENHSPMPEALTLAAEATGDPKVMQSAQEFAATMTSGLPVMVYETSAFPPLVGWLLSGRKGSGALLPALKHAASAYHRRARHQADMLRLLLPIGLTVLVGGSVTVIYALTLFIPYTTLLRAMGG